MSTRFWCSVFLWWSSDKDSLVQQWTTTFSRNFPGRGLGGFDKICALQESIPVGCVPPAFYRTETPLDRDPRQRPPTETPLKEHRTRNRDPPKEHGTRQSDIQRPPSPWTEWLTRACENITLRQTSFAGGKNLQSQSVEEEGFKGNHNILFYNPQARQSATHCKVWWPPWCDGTISRF